MLQEERKMEKQQKMLDKKNESAILVFGKNKKHAKQVNTKDKNPKSAGVPIHDGRDKAEVVGMMDGQA